MQKKIITKIFCPPPPFSPQKISGPTLLPRKIQVNLIEKHVNSIFTGKFVLIFFSPPYKGQKFSGSSFLHQIPLTSVCEWSLMQKINDAKNVLIVGVLLYMYHDCMPIIHIHFVMHW